MAHLTIGIIGAGRMGGAFARRLAAAGHTVRVTARDAAAAEQAATKAGATVRAVRLDEIAEGADVLLLAVPYSAGADALRAVDGAAGALAGKAVIEMSNPFTPDMAGLLVGHTTSAAEEMQQAVPHAHVVKAFNAIFWDTVGAPAPADRPTAQIFYAGDDAAAKDAVRAVIESAGFEPMDAGPLANARLLEPLGLLNIRLGPMSGRGTGLAPAWVAVAVA